MKTIEVKTSELEGAALDWAMAKASGMPFYTQGEDWPGNYRVTQQAGEEPVIIRALIGTLWLEFQGKTTPWSPSTDWSQGGPLIDKYRIELRTSGKSNWWADKSMLREGFPDQNDWCGFGPSALIAVCRAVVEARLGDTVSVPAELIGGAE